MQAIAVLPQGMEMEGIKELDALGAKSLKPLKRSASFEADLACFYRLHLLARLPFRILREISSFAISGPESLYLGVQNALDWEKWLCPSMSFRVDVSGYSSALTHSHYTALQVKNAIVDLQRSIWGDRSSIDLQEPDIVLHLHLSRGDAVLSLDGTASSLHRRGYRSALGEAPLKENLASGLMRITNWDFSRPLVDPLCGSGTLLIEAVSIALNLAPGLYRSFLFENWVDFDNDLWVNEKELAKSNQFMNKKLPAIIGCEHRFDIANQARKNIFDAGLDKFITIETKHFRDLDLPWNQGLIVCNPPYGKRIGDVEDLPFLYGELGDFAKNKASGWQLWMLSGNPQLTRFLRMKSKRRIPVSNGGIDCRWLHYDVN